MMRAFFLSHVSSWPCTEVGNNCTYTRDGGGFSENLCILVNSKRTTMKLLYCKQPGK